MKYDYEKFYLFYYEKNEPFFFLHKMISSWRKLFSMRTLFIGKDIINFETYERYNVVVFSSHVFTLKLFLKCIEKIFMSLDFIYLLIRLNSSLISKLREKIVSDDLHLMIMLMNQYFSKKVIRKKKRRRFIVQGWQFERHYWLSESNWMVQ